ncbi:isoprenyl transferase [Actinoalloteichus spitiensis]|uniref:isoprenyl transferase n=1 Tax=Actinoalloteichus spitiensis TaxID=252394 RepID=UPI000363A94F
MLSRHRWGRERSGVSAPDPHPSGAQPPAIPRELVPNHVALVMDGNGRWARARGLPRTEGHRRGEAVLIDVVGGAIELGVKWLSVYAFSTENWKRSPEEVRFLMGFNRDVIRRQVDYLDSIGVRVRWAGRRPRLWRSVIRELEIAQERTKDNDVLTLTMCVNYGGRAEIADAARELGRLVAAGKLNPERIDERMLTRRLYEPNMPDVDLFLRPSGEQRTSNFMLWQSAYAEMVFLDTLFPDFDRRELWKACDIYARRDRRFGGVKTPVAADVPATETHPEREDLPSWEEREVTPDPTDGEWDVEPGDDEDTEGKGGDGVGEADQRPAGDAR